MALVERHKVNAGTLNVSEETLYTNRSVSSYLLSRTVNTDFS